MSKIATEYADFISQLMKRDGITATQLAARAGLTKGRISQLLSPRASPTPRDVADQYARLALALHCPAEALCAAVAAGRPDLARSTQWTYVAPVLCYAFASPGTEDYSEDAIRAAAKEMVAQFTIQSRVDYDPRQWPEDFADRVADHMHNAAQRHDADAARKHSQQMSAIAA